MDERKLWYDLRASISKMVTSEEAMLCEVDTKNGFSISTESPSGKMKESTTD